MQGWRLLAYMAIHVPTVRMPTVLHRYYRVNDNYLGNDGQTAIEMDFPTNAKEPRDMAKLNFFDWADG